MMLYLHIVENISVVNIFSDPWCRYFPGLSSQTLPIYSNTLGYFKIFNSPIIFPILFRAHELYFFTMLYFLLNRKQICDFFTNISVMQIQLYEDFAKSQAKRGLEQTVGMEVEEEAENDEKKTKVQGTHHVFQVLYMALIRGVKNFALKSCWRVFVLL